tara:strand:- start:734 stop:1096 length:363 start_codon:yes stop_codon:yes gene_type:complete
MKKIKPLFFIVIIFSTSLLYLHQKIQIFTQGYQLSSNYTAYNDLVDKKDYLMYNLTKEISIAKVNQWAKKENFQPVEKDKILVFNTESKQTVDNNKIALLLNRIMGASASTSTALANENQ